MSGMRSHGRAAHDCGSGGGDSLTIDNHFFLWFFGRWSDTIVQIEVEGAASELLFL
jgi:hypothetical protein